MFTLFVRPVYQLGYVVYYGMNLKYVIDKYCVNKERPKLNCDGKCYLMQKLSAAEDNSNDEDKRTTRFTEMVFPLFFQTTSYDWRAHLKDTKKSIDEQADLIYMSPLQNIALPPPKV